MSIRVNQIEVPIYEEDSRDKILNRVASSLNTLPKYIYGFPQEIKKDTDYKVTDFLETIKNDNESTDFRGFLDNNSDIINSLNVNIKNDILLPWLGYNNAIENLAIYAEVILYSVGEDLVQDGYFKDLDDFKRAFRDRKIIITRLGEQLEKIKEEEKVFKEITQTIDKVQGIYYSDFILERISIKSFLQIDNVTILELFNLILTNENVPFATCQNYYKIYKDFVPPSREESDEKYDWDISLQDIITLKVFSTNVSDYKKYSNVYISVENGKVFLKTKLDVQKIYASQDMMLKRIISAFNTPEPIPYSEPIQEKVIGTFYFPGYYVNTYILSDLIMNNSLFSAYLNTLEFNKVSKKIDLTGQTWLSMWFTEDNKIVSASLSRKTIDRKDFYIRGTDPKVFVHGEPSIRVHASGKNIQVINRFMEILSKLLRVYKNEEEKIKLFYKRILPDFGDYGIEEVGELKKAELDRNVFVKDYSRTCPKMPTEITKDEALRLIENKEKDVLLYPRDYPEIGPRYNSDGINQKYYICDHKDFPYIGVKENKKLSNKEDYPYIPCCYQNPQSEFDKDKRKRYQNYDLYYKGTKVSDKEDVKQPKFIITNKILKSDKTGVLPNKLLKIFDGINDKENLKFIRMGVDRNKSSFLNCVLTALQKLNITSEAKRTEKLKNLRNDLGTKSLAILAKQSYYEPTLSQLTNKIKNFDEYFDPKYYLQMIEQLFNCNIYVFDNEKMVLPNSIEGLYRTKKSGNTILIYEHMGSEFDAATYPQCELIVRWDQTTENNIEYSFKSDSEISKKIEMMYMLFNASYINGYLLENIEAKLPMKIISSQILDAFGKCRIINIDDGIKFSVFLSPIEPLRIIPLEKKGIKFVKKENLSEVRNILENNGFTFETSTRGYIGNVKFEIQLLKHNLETLQESRIKIFNFNKKIARYLTQYVFWCFSRFFDKSNKSDIDKDILNQFAIQGFIINSSHKYDNVPKTFGLDNYIVNKEGKIIVTNIEMIKRLMYSLRLEIIQREDEIKNYKDLVSMKGYYEDITDFNIYTDQILLSGEESVDKWIINSKENIINPGVILNSIEPYFFLNKKIGNKVFIAQNIDTLEKALDIALKWNIDNFNIGNYASNIKTNYEFNLYSYSNPQDIQLYKVKGDKPEKPINIIGYKVNGKSKFTVLLK